MIDARFVALTQFYELPAALQRRLLPHAARDPQHAAAMRAREDGLARLARWQREQRERQRAYDDWARRSKYQ